MQPHEASLRPDDGAAATSLAEDQLTDATDLLCMMMRPPAELWDGQKEEWDGLRGSLGPIASHVSMQVATMMAEVTRSPRLPPIAGQRADGGRTDERA